MQKHTVDEGRHAQNLKKKQKKKKDQQVNESLPCMFMHTDAHREDIGQDREIPFHHIAPLRTGVSSTHVTAHRQLTE